MGKTNQNKKGFEIFLGKEVYDTNRIEQSFNKEDYKELIAQAHSLGGISIPALLNIQRQPCQNCGCDNILIKKIPLQISKTFRRVPQVHLYVFINSDIDKKYKKCDLIIDYSLRCVMGVNEGSFIYTIQGERFSYKGGDSESVVVSVMKNKIPYHSIICSIKDGVVFSK